MTDFERIKKMDNKTIINLYDAINQFDCSKIHCGECPMNYADPTHYPEVFKNLPCGFEGCLVVDVRAERNERGI